MRWYLLAAFGLICMICYIHHYIFDVKQKKIGPWFHFWWGCAYAIPCTIAVWRLGWNWWLATAFLLERFSFYNPTLNLIRGRYFFYIVASNSKPGLWDKIELLWKGFYPVIWSAGTLGFIISIFRI